MDDTHKWMEEKQTEPGEFNSLQDKACLEQGVDRDPDLTTERLGANN